MEYRIPPQAIEAEKSVIGTMMVDNTTINSVLEILTQTDFYDLQYQEIFTAIVELFNKNKTIDIITVADILKEKGKLEEVGGYNTLADLVDIIATSQSILHHSKIVKNQSQRRQLIQASNSILDMAYGNDEIELIIEASEKNILGIDRHNNTTIFSLADTLSSTVEQLENRCKNRGQISGIPTGFIGLDYKLGGLQNSDLIIIAARPSMGKTSLAVDIATNVSISKQLPTAFFSLEMKKEKIANRILSGWNFIDNQKIRLGTMDDDDWGKLARSIGPLSEGKLIIDDTPNMKASEIKARCRRIKNKMGGLALIVVDHLTEMWRPRRGTDASEHEENVRCMKRLAAEMDCPVILLQQLNRGVEGRTDKRPQLSDLKETGAAEEVADVVIMIYRDDYYNPDSEKKNIAEIIIAKGRDVGTGTVELAWLGQYTKFANLERMRKE